jgi:DNA-binding LacI/PurR family transcriptional regulator
MVPAGQSGQVETVLRAAVDGFVLSSIAATDPLLAAVLSRPQPAVIVDSPRGVAGVDFVGIDDRAAFAAIAGHVFELGHRRVGVVTVRRGEDVPAEPVPSPLSQRLATGLDPHPVRQLRLTGLAEVAPEPAGVLVTERPANSRDEGALGARALLAALPGLTAIMCTSDILALGVLDELAERRIPVGAGLTVTGFDDVPAAGHAGLTTVRQPLEGKGRAAIESLLDDRPRTVASTVVLPTELVVRSSSGPAR